MRWAQFALGGLCYLGVLLGLVWFLKEAMVVAALWMRL